MRLYIDMLYVYILTYFSIDLFMYIYIYIYIFSKGSKCGIYGRFGFWRIPTVSVPRPMTRGCPSSGTFWDNGGPRGCPATKRLRASGLPETRKPKA